jgi:3-deoxy-D-manno-octulosonic-acid transferase
MGGSVAKAVASRMTLPDRLYAVGGPCAFALARLAARATGESTAALRQRSGYLPPARHPLLWFHGASAGELSAAARLAGLLRDGGHTFTAGYTTTNRAGLDLAMRVAGAGDVAALAPWDTPRWVARAMDAWRPCALLLVETELWPRLVFEAARRNIPVFAVSARIYPRDVPRYRAIRAFLRPTLERLTAVLVQSPAEYERFVSIGAAPERCLVAGNLKYLAPAQPLAASTLARDLGDGTGAPIVVCGSMHEDEMGFLLAALVRLNRPDVRLIIAPRHARGVTAAAAAAARHGWNVWRRSSGPAPACWRLLLLDTVGELGEAYAMASVAVVGGGFGMHGGHNPFEPLLAGVPVILGSHMHHFAGEAGALARAAPEACVASTGALAERLRQWLGDDALRRNVIARQRAALPDAEAIAKQYLGVLSPWLRNGKLA